MCLADTLIKVLSWFCLERDWGRPSTRVTEIREWSNVASIRKTEIIFKVGAGAAFWNPWSPDLPCLSGLLLMTLSWVGSRVLVPSSPAREEPYREFICPGKMTWSCFCRGNFCCSVTQLCPTLCHPVHYSTPGFCVLPYLLEFAQTHVRWVDDAVQPSHPLLPPSPPALNLSQYQSLYQWVNSSYQVAKVLKLQLQHQSFQWIFRLISFKIDWFDLAGQGTL